MDDEHPESPILDLWLGWDSDTRANICIWHFFSLLNEFIFSSPQCHVQGGNEDYSFNNLWLQHLLNFSPYWQHFTYRHHISAKHWQYQFALATVFLVYVASIHVSKYQFNYNTFQVLSLILHSVWFFFHFLFFLSFLFLI